ncbi:hypothetical protein [[Clostridium] symbiosum]|uniref:hypothetical protein n=1 Tax=Clostridium symbiosum TaxID=1512 RepID=UPI001FB64C4D|nr:hypothetical protein [[Clostridium] symbiosum]
MIDEVKRYVKEILMIVEFEIWERNRKKHMILQTRNIQNNMTLLPYESDFLCLIYDYCKMNRIYINEIKKYNNVRLYVFKILLKNNMDITAFPVGITKHELILRCEQQEPDGFHSVVDKEIKIQLCDIKVIKVIRDCDDVDVGNLEISKPMYGYKAIPEINGRLKTKGCEYRLNIPCIVKVRNPYATDFQDCYLHFCTTIEGVALCPGRTDYLESINNYKKGSLSAIRLFRVKAEGHCVQYSGDWWVTNKLTVINEVTKEEIYSYFMNNSLIKAKVIKHLKLNHDFWDGFLKSEIPPFIESETGMT